MSLAQHTLHSVETSDGWRLDLKQCRLPHPLQKKRRPVVIIPGYGMNAFIFGYHPRGLSLEEFLTQQGLEVWSVNLRGQGDSRPPKREQPYGLKELAVIDLQAALSHIIRQCRSEVGKADLIGCSLGGTLAYINAAVVHPNHVGSIVAIGAPLRWEETHPALKLLARLPIGWVPMKRTRELIQWISPLLTKTPLLHLYLHPEIVDLRHSQILLETVEDPNRHMNREIADWIRNKDLRLNGKNLTREFRKVKNPLLCVVANADGIVPPLTALSAYEASRSPRKEVLVVGTDQIRLAHADLFISNHCHEMVFQPIANWLLKQY